MKKVLFLLVVLLIPFSIKAETLLAPTATSVIVMEQTPGEIIYEKNSHEKLNPASMTKIMTMLLAIEAIENKIINFEDIVTVSENASNMGGSQILLETGEQMSVYDLFKGVAVASGNFISYVRRSAIKFTGQSKILNVQKNSKKKIIQKLSENNKNLTSKS